MMFGRKIVPVYIEKGIDAMHTSNRHVISIATATLHRVKISYKLKTWKKLL
jgi:hypothetical protein